MADHQNIGWLRERLRASLAIEAQDPAELLEWLEARRKDVPFSAELIPLREVAGWQQAENGNIGHVTGQFFRIEGARVRSAPGLREIAGWDQPILTQSDGGALALLCRETAERGVEFLLQAKADPGNIGYLQFCPTIQSTWENIRGLRGARRAPFAEIIERTQLHPPHQKRLSCPAGRTSHDRSRASSSVAPGVQSSATMNGCTLRTELQSRDTSASRNR